MSSISDRIERMIKQMLEESDGEILIVRNEMASRINVVPSQISYVPVSYTHLDVYKRQTFPWEKKELSQNTVCVAR